MKGLDFGTSTSLISESGPARTAVIPIGRTEKWVPSLVARSGATWVAGDNALAFSEEQVIRSAKRAITRRADSFTVFDGKRHVEVDADEVIREILREIVVVADDAFVSLDDESEVRLGCPAMWEGDQRRRLIRLAKEAGISVSENTVIDEPIAAGIAWVNQRTREGQQVSGKLLVFDMGGGTLDVAVLHVDARPTEPGKKRIPPLVSVQSSIGIDEAGDALDDAMEVDFCERLLQVGFDVNRHPAREELVGWLRRAARVAKVELSSAQDTTVVVGHPTIEVPTFTYSRDELETAFRPQLDRALEVVRLALRAALMAQVKSPTDERSMTPVDARFYSDENLASGVQYVVLAGGMSHIPAVRERMGELFGGDRIWLGADEGSSRGGVGSAEMIALGLSYHEDSDRMNLHRPGFDFVLEWTEPGTGERREVVVYQAYSPLYTRTQVYYNNNTKYTWKPKTKEELPRRGEGLLTVRALSGERLDFTYRGMLLPGIRMDFGAGDFTITLEPNGRVFWRDGAGRTGAVRVAQWPVIRGSKQETIAIKDIEEENDGRWSVESLPWHLKPYD
jgi:hypothetical protein